MSEQKPREFIKSLVDRFLGWKLPKGVRPDPYPPGHIHEDCNSGTNLLTATEAQQLFEFLFPFDPETNSATGWMIKYQRQLSAYDAVVKERDELKRVLRECYNGPGNVKAVSTLMDERDTLAAQLAEAKSTYLVDDILAEKNERIAELERKLDHCIHPGCCCVCGHKGKCPEDGASIIEGVTE